MYNRIVSFLWLLNTALTSIILYFIALIIWALTLPFDRRKKILHIFTCAWASIYTFVMPAWRISILGRNKVRKNERYVIVSNHQSQLDILVAFRLFFHFKWVSKAEIFTIPFIGWNMVLNKYVRLKRGDRESIKKMMDACGWHIDNGSPVYFFPEGTRSNDGIMKKFKHGAFELALQKKVPILPIAISGTFEALPKYSMNFHGKQKITVEVLDEIPYENFRDTDPGVLAEQVRGIISSRVEELNAIRHGR